MKVIEESGIREYLQKRQITEAYCKQKTLIESGYFDVVELKKMKPKTAGIVYFRITKKYRAIGFIEGEILVVTKIWDHQ